MTIPTFTAQSSLYRTSNRYRSSGGELGGSIPAQPVIAAYIPGPETQNRCGGCTDVCAATRDICLAKAGAMVAEACWTSLGFGCGPAIALGYIQAASCEALYLECFGDCNIPSIGPWKSPCCPKPCGFPTDPGVGGSGCCDDGETCKGLGARENTRDGCCPVGRDCGSVCCAAGEKCCGEVCCPSNHYCLDKYTCSELPGSFPNTPPPPPPVDNCNFFEGGTRCGSKCCYGGLKCCGVDINGQPICMTSCTR